MLLLIIGGTLGIAAAWQVAQAIYYVYFHPLKDFPGPKIWIAFPVISIIAQCLGQFDRYMMRFHRQYGEVVRFSDHCLSFATGSAWKDIYGATHPQMQRLDTRPPGQPPNILFSDDVEHARFRRALGSAFSEKAVREQEVLNKQYIDTMIQSLREKAYAGKFVDMTMWYNLCTFDIVSDLAFGEPSDCLKKQGYTPFVSNIFKFMKVIPFIRLLSFYPLVFQTIMLVLRSRIKKGANGMEEMARKTVEKRMNGEKHQGRHDFVESMLNYRDTKEAISDETMRSNCLILFVAGSETVATLSAGVTYYLCQYPEELKRATEEVRAAFEKEEDITFASTVTKVPFLVACLEEALRIYPPSPSALLRLTPDYTTISGYIVPPKTEVGVHGHATNTSADNFYDPWSFRPERWLPDIFNDPTSSYYHDNREARQAFSYGPRNCIGRTLAYCQMRQIMSQMLWNFDIELANPTENWADQKAYALWEKKPLNCRLRVKGTA